MKTAQLPPVRVEPEVRAEIENALRDGESLSEFVEAAALQVARRRMAEQAFLARGRSSMAKAKKSGEFYPLQGALDGMLARLEDRMRAHKTAHKTAHETAHQTTHKSTGPRAKPRAADKR